MATPRRVVVLLAAVLVGWAGTVLAGTEGAAQAAFDRAMAALAESATGSDSEARAMGQAVAAVRGLAATPAVPDAARAHVERATAAAKAARGSAAFLAAAKEFTQAARLAPWVAEYQFSRGILLEKAGHHSEAVRALDLYLQAAPEATDRTEVRKLIAGLGRINEKADPAFPPARLESHPAGETFRDCPDCPEMVALPAGRFSMGSPEDEQGRFDSEGPRHQVSVRSFALGKYDVTEAEFLAFLRATGYQPNPCDPLLGITWRTPRRGLAYSPGSADSPRQPAVCLSWYDAQTYLAWLNSKVRERLTPSAGTDGPYRLPNEAEWEYAARAGTTTARLWGDAIGVGNANCHGCGSPWDNRFIAPAASFGPNPFGLYDMLGNVWQWNSDCWHENYAGAPKDGSAWTAGNCSKRVMRGGSWSNVPVFVRAATRAWGDATGNEYDYAGYVGFRIARALP